MLQFQMPIKQPPDKLSDLLELALNDLEAVKKINKYKLRMGTWHSVKENGLCYVCMAGAVMANTLRASPNENWYPEDYQPEWESALKAIDLMRTGWFDRSYTRIRAAGPLVGLGSLLQDLRDLVRNNFDEEEQMAPTHIYREAIIKLRKAGL